MIETSSRFILRPLSTVELIDRCFTVYRQAFSPLFLFALLVSLPPFVTTLAFNLTGLSPYGVLSRDPGQNGSLQHPGLDAAEFGIFCVFMLFSALLASLLQTAALDCTGKIYLGQPAAIVPSLKKMFPRFPIIFWTASLLLLCLVISLLPSLAVAIAGIHYSASYIQSDPPRAIFLVVLTLFAVLVALIPAVLVFMQLLLVYPILAVEDKWGWTALLRSSKLVNFNPKLGFWYWGGIRLTILYIPLFCLQLLAGIVSSLPLFIDWITFYLQTGTVGPFQAHQVSMAASRGLQFLTTGLIQPLFFLASMLFYLDVRVRREGYDLELTLNQPAPGPNLA